MTVTTDTATPLLEIVSDVVCPWCYVGKRRLSQALAQLEDFPLRIRWRPYELNPTMPREGMARREYCERKFGSLQQANQLYARVVAAAHRPLTLTVGPPATFRPDNAVVYLTVGLTEALATNLVQHPGIVSVSEFGQTADGLAYIAGAQCAAGVRTIKMHRNSFQAPRFQAGAKARLTGDGRAFVKPRARTGSLTDKNHADTPPDYDIRSAGPAV